MASDPAGWGKDWEQLHLYLDREPGDLSARLVLADLLEEQGQLVESQFQRWLVRHQCWPDGNLDEFQLTGWHWWSSVGESSRHRHHAVLPTSVQIHMPFREWIYNSRKQAEAALLEVLLRTDLLDK
jgi:uncharacterized protein (TIGR02996 family)